MQNPPQADDLIEAFDGTSVAGWSNEEMSAYIKEHNIPCPNCGANNFTDIRQFNLMFKTFQALPRIPRMNLSPPRNRAGHLRKLCKYSENYEEKGSFRRCADR
jgi:predicted nucleic-acid-binding Zn-ribbon protein